MSNLFKSKFLLGVMVVAVMFVAFAVKAPRASADCSITMTLKQGMTSSQVMCLQQMLNAKGFTVSSSGAGSMGYETSYFGSLTAMAVRSFQASNSLTADAVVGPLTRAALMVSANVVVTPPAPTLCPNGMTLASSCTLAPNATAASTCPNGMTLASNCTLAPGATTTTQPLCPNGMTVASNCSLSPITGNANGAGSVAEYKILATPADNREVVQGAGSTQVLGMSIEADPGSDLTLTAVKLDFHNDGDAGEVTATADRDFVKYASSVAVYLGTTQLALVNASEFTSDNDYSRTLSLSSSGAKIPAGQVGNLYVAVTSISNLDSADDGEIWEVDVTSVRFTDGQGAVVSEDPATGLRAFTFETPTSSGDLDLKVSEATGNPDAQVVEADDVNDTNGVVLLKSTLKASGSAIELKELQTTVTPAGTGDASEIASRYILRINGNDIQSLDSGACDVVGDCDGTGTATAVDYTFDDVDYTIAENATVTMEIVADINPIDGVIVAEGDSLVADFTMADADNIVRDSSGDDLVGGDKTGAIAGEAQTFYSVGFKFVKKSTTSAITFAADPATATSADTATYTIKFDLTAFGGDVTIDRSCEEGGADAADQGVEYVVTNNGSNTSACSLASTAEDNTDDTGAAWLLRDGQTKEFTLTVAVTATADHFAKVYLESINWDNLVTDTTPDLYYTAGLGETKTSTGELYLQFI